MASKRNPPQDQAPDRRRARKVARAMKRSLRKQGRRPVNELSEGGMEKLRPGRLQSVAAQLDTGDVAEAKVDGLVVAVSRKGCTVRCAGEDDVRLWFHNHVASAAVGDVVGFDPELPVDRALACVRERRTTLSRPDPFDPTLERVIAANVDVAVLVVAPSEGVLRTGLIDRMLIAVQRGGVTPVLVVNKRDLLGDVQAAETALAPYRDLGVEPLLSAATLGDGLAPLRERLRGRTCVFVGHSGVGKSSLLNALWPEAAQETAAVRARDGRGRHTTTASRLVDLPGDTRLIDTPGIRSFGLWQVDGDALRGWFNDFDEAAAGCRFRDCRHDAEPGCAVREAAESGDLAPARYATYLRILASL